MDESGRFKDAHPALTRRSMLQVGVSGLAMTGWNSLAPCLSAGPAVDQGFPEFESFLTPAQNFRDVSRGNPIPHTLPEDKLRAAGLTRESWKLEVVSDSEHPAKLGRQLRKEDGSAFDFAALMKLAETRAVRFAKVMTCLNIGCPLGMGIWEGIPLREVIGLTQPREDVRRVFYYGYHNDDPAQMFLSSLPLARVLEDPFDLPPVILCYKLNGQWLDSQRGGPVRIVVPEAYGFKSIKWLSHVVLSNLAHANDTYASGNNDVDSPLKSFAATLVVPVAPEAGKATVVTGYAQVGISGLKRVQYWLARADEEWPADDKHFTAAPWLDADILPPPQEWSADIKTREAIAGAIGFDQDGRPGTWPMRLGKAQWVANIPPQSAGEYIFRCRTVDEKGIAQPLPRPMRKSGHAAIEEVTLRFG